MTRKIRVLHILDELNTGGAEHIVVSYFKYIDRTKFQWDFIITKYADPSKRGLLEETVERLGGKIFRVTRKKESYLRNIKETALVIKNGHYDIVHSHLDELSAPYLMSAKRYNVPVRICHSHLAGADRGKGVEVLCRIYKPLLKYCVTSKFACGINAGIALWGKKDVQSGSVYIMHNAIETSDFKFSNDVSRLKRVQLGISKEVVFGSVGRFAYQKNPEFVIDIFNEYHNENPNSVLLMVGEGELLGTIKERIREYKLENAVKLLGRRDDVNELMSAMDCLLLPSRFEGLPIVLVEAQCNGLACLVSDTVTREIRINDNVKYISLQRNPGYWVMKYKQIENMNFDRESGLKSVINGGYQIQTEAQNLQDKYMKEVSSKLGE